MNNTFLIWGQYLSPTDIEKKLSEIDFNPYERTKQPAIRTIKVERFHLEQLWNTVFNCDFYFPAILLEILDVGGDFFRRSNYGPNEFEQMLTTEGFIGDVTDLGYVLYERMPPSYSHTINTISGLSSVFILCIARELKRLSLFDRMSWEFAESTMRILEKSCDNQKKRLLYDCVLLPGDVRWWFCEEAVNYAMGAIRYFFDDNGRFPYTWGEFLPLFREVSHKDQDLYISTNYFEAPEDDSSKYRDLSGFVDVNFDLLKMIDSNNGTIEAAEKKEIVENNLWWIIRDKNNFFQCREWIGSDSVSQANNDINALCKIKAL